MDSRYLESFIMVAECGSIAEAARRLNLTAAALAQRLRSLEADVGQSLVVRSGRTVQPTAAGLAILDHARMLVAGARDLRAVAGQGLPAGQLRLGATATAMTGILPGVIADLGMKHPAIDYFVQPGSSVDLYHRLIEKHLDAVIVVKPNFPLPKSVDWLTMRHEPLVLITSEADAGKDLATQVSEAQFIRYDRNQWGGQIVDTYLRENGFQVREWLELDALDAIAAMVDRGLGFSILPDWGTPWPEGLRIGKTVLEGGDARQTGVLWRRSTARLAALNAFVESCRSVAQPLA